MKTKNKTAKFTRLLELKEENREIILFDLLEGNFSEVDAAKVKSFIDSNEEWQQEWDLLKMCVLEPDLEITYTHKDSLLKSEDDKTPVIVPMKRYYWMAAASVILMAAWYVFYEPQKTSLDYVNGPVKVQIDTFTGNVSQPVIVKEELPLPVPVEKEIVAKPQNRKTMPERIVPAQEEPVITSSSKPELIDMDLRSPSLTPVFESVVASVLPVDRKQAPAIKDENQEAWTIRNARSRIAQSLKQTIEPYSDPKISFKRGVAKNNPVVWVTLSTQAYQANATLIIKTNEVNP